MNDELIQLSGLRHVLFCPRRFALIHMEQVWRENRLTAEGRVVHDNAHDPFFTEKRKELLITRAVPVVSYVLGISGECDVVEWRNGDSGVSIDGRIGFWQPTPIEYKRGKPMKEAFDEVQLCAQAICLEEMLCVHIDKGYLYYEEIRSRIEIVFDEILREKVTEAAKEAYLILESGILPAPNRPKTKCRNCSLFDECMPAAKTNKSAKAYIRSHMDEISPVEEMAD